MNFMFLQLLGLDQLVFSINVLIMVKTMYLIYMDCGLAVNQVGLMNAQKFNLLKIILIASSNKIYINIGIVSIIQIGHF